MQPRPTSLVWADPVWMERPFGEPYGNPLLNWERAEAIDITGNGRAEIVISTASTGANDRPNVPEPLIVLGWRGGQMVDITAEVLPKGVGAVLLRGFQTGDFNGDGRADLFLDNTGTEGIFPFPGEQNRLLLSDGKGRLKDTTAALPQLTDFSHGSVVADFDGDGHLDIFVNNLLDDDAVPSYLLLGDGKGRFSEPLFVRSAGDFAGDPRFDAVLQTRGTGYYPGLIDWGRTGAADLWFGPSFTYEGGGGPEFVGHTVLRNDGAGNFTVETRPALAPALPEGDISSGRYAGEMTRWGDLNNDGHPDLVVYWDAMGEGFFLQLLESRPGGYVDVSQRIEGQARGGRLAPLAGTPDFQLVDFDGDGDLDIVAMRFTPDFSGKRVEWFESRGGQFHRIAEEAFPGDPGFIIADVTGDGIPDLVSLRAVWDLPNTPEFDLGGHLAAVRPGVIDRAVNRKGWSTDDRIVGGNLNDTLSGLGGDDHLRGNGGNDRLLGGGGHDTLVGDADNDTLIGGAGDDRLDGGTGNDRLDGGGGADLVLGGDGADTLLGKAGADTLRGGTGNDRLTGGGGADRLEGGGGHDTLAGGGGNDRLDGGTGNDVLTGGKGADTFVFRKGYGTDRITDFRPDQGDRVVLSTQLWGGKPSIDDLIDRFATTVDGAVALRFSPSDVLIFDGISDPSVIAGQIDIL
jgi:hypothetical protein